MADAGGATGVSVGANYGWGDSSGTNQVGYFSPDAIARLIYQGVNGGMNQGALADMILGGNGFGRSRNYNQNRPSTRNWDGSPETVGSYGATNPGGGPNTPVGGGGAIDPETGLPFDPETGGGGAGAPQGNNFRATAAPGGEDPSIGTGPPPKTGTKPNPNQHPGYTQWTGFGNPTLGGTRNDDFAVTDEGPSGDDGLLGDLNRYGSWNELDNKLGHDLDWQSSGDLMDLETQEKGLWDQFGQTNDLEKKTDQAINWQRSGDLSDLEQQNKWGYINYGKDTDLEGEMGAGYRKFGQGTDLENEVGNSWRGVAGPGQYDPLRGDTLEGMVKNPGFSASEKSSLKASQLLPIQSALEAQKLEGNARQAATGNAAGRWGASNAMALNAAGQASQAGRNVELDSANMMRTDRAQGLSGLGDLQGQMDARKVQGAQGLQSLSGQQRQAGLASLQGLGDLNATQRAAKLTSTQGIGDVAKNQRANQQFGINAGMQLNDQQRGAQAKAAEGIGNLGQRQRANTQWGLGALSDLNKQKSDQQLAGIGLKKDMYDTTLNQGNKDSDRAAQLAGLVTGGKAASDSSSGGVGVSF